MRRAVQIIALVLMVMLGIQSCAVTLGGSAAKNLSVTGAGREQGEDLAGAGASGVIAAFLWLIAAAFVVSRPKLAAWVFGGAGLFCLLGATSGFSSLWFWMVVSLALAAMSWRGIAEKEREAEEASARYRTDVQAAAEAVMAQADRTGAERAPESDGPGAGPIGSGQ